MKQLSSVATKHDLLRTLHEVNASGYSYCSGKSYVEFGSASVLLRHPLLRNSDTPRTVVEITENEQQNLISLVEKITQSSSPLIVLGTNTSKESARFIDKMLTELNYTVSVTEDADFSVRQLQTCDVDYLIVTTHAKSFQDFAISTLLTSEHTVNVFCQSFNVSYFSVRLPKLCKTCSKDVVTKDSDKSHSRKGFSYTKETYKRSSMIGCDDCVGGFSGVYLATEMLSNRNEKMLDSLSSALIAEQGPAYKRFVNKLYKENTKTIYGNAAAAVEQGFISLDDVYKSLL